MGTGLLGEGMFDSVLRARDLWLRYDSCERNSQPPSLCLNFHPGLLKTVICQDRLGTSIRDMGTVFAGRVVGYCRVLRGCLSLAGSTRLLRSCCASG